MKQLILVFGPRSSGTRFFTGLLIRCGAVGDDGHEQRLDAMSNYWSGYIPRCSFNEAFELLDGGGYAVLRRSIPHGSGYPNIEPEQLGFMDLGVETKCVFWMQRDVFATCKSMVDSKHERTMDAALESVQLALERIALPVIPVTYEMLGHNLYVNNLFKLAGLSLRVKGPTGFIDGNRKYYERDQRTDSKEPKRVCLPAL